MEEFRGVLGALLGVSWGHCVRNAAANACVPQVDDDGSVATRAVNWCEEDVVRLQIAMGDVSVVHLSQAISQGGDDIEGLELGWVKNITWASCCLNSRAILLFVKQYVELQRTHQSSTLQVFCEGNHRWLIMRGVIISGTRFNRKTVFQSIGIHILKIRRLWNRLIFMMGSPILIRLYLYITTTQASIN